MMMTIIFVHPSARHSTVGRASAVADDDDDDDDEDEDGEDGDDNDFFSP